MVFERPDTSCYTGISFTKKGDVIKKGRIEEVDIFVGAFLKRLRLEKKISHVKIAETLCYHVTPQQLQKYETGKNRISIARLRQYLHVLDMSLVEFFYPYSPSR